jgi:hypothetical protein
MQFYTTKLKNSTFSMSLIRPIYAILVHIKQSGGYMKKFLLTCLFFTLLFSGCARYYIISIDSINNREIPVNKTYIITAGNKDTSAADLQFQEYARFLSKALSLLGYTLAATPKLAAIEIYLSYGVGEPESQVYSYAEPVWGQLRTDVNTYTTETTYTSPSGGDTKAYNSTTRIDPEYGVTGYTTKTGVYTAYNKFIIMDAYDIKTKQKDNKLKHLWKTSVSSTGMSKDLRKLFPLMIAAAKKYIGANTGEELEIQYPEESEEVKNLKANN